MTRLDAATAQQFDAYAKSVEQELAARWHTGRGFLSIDEDAAERERVLAGAVVVRRGAEPDPKQVQNGLIHDWVGTLFIPEASLTRVLRVLQDFDRHARIYPGVIESRLLKRDHDDVEGYWRLERRDPVLTVVLDVKQQAHYEQVAPGRWTCRAYARDIQEIVDAGTTREKRLPPGEGHGFLWRMYAYWSLEREGSGVLAECRTLSLSRDVPAVIAWAINPFVQTLPRESLAATLEHTRDAARQ